MKNFQYIISNPAILGGKPCIKGTRISIELIWEWLASGASFTDITQKYPHIPIEGLQQALLYTAGMFKNEIVAEFNISA